MPNNHPYSRWAYGLAVIVSSAPTLVYLYMAWKSIAIPYFLSVAAGSLSLTGTAMLILLMIPWKKAHKQGEGGLRALVERVFYKVPESLPDETDPNQKTKSESYHIILAIWVGLKEIIKATCRPLQKMTALVQGTLTGVALLMVLQHTSKRLMMLSINAALGTIGVFTALLFLLGILTVPTFMVLAKETSSARPNGIRAIRDWIKFAALYTITFVVLLSPAGLLVFLPLATVKGFLMGAQNWLGILFISATALCAISALMCIWPQNTEDNKPPRANPRALSSVNLMSMDTVVEHSTPEPQDLERTCYSCFGKPVVLNEFSSPV